MPRGIAQIKAILADRRKASSEQHEERPGKSSTRHGFDPGQPRVPAGNEHGGEWTETQDDARILSDATTDDDWTPGAQYAGAGHHWFPRKFWSQIPPETRKVFDRATSGHIPLGLRDKLEGKTKRHEYDEFHRQYNLAVEDLMENFVRDHGIEWENLTPQHAFEILDLVANSQDVRIKYYREFIRALRRFYRLRTGGRGTE
jgi:hypothetical protein